MIANPDYDSEFKLDGDGGGVSYTLGLMLRPTDRTQIGIAYTGSSEIKYDGNAAFTHPTNDYSAMLSTQMPFYQNGSTTLNFPSSLNFGIKYDLSPVWDAEFDFNYVDWSGYDKLVIDFDKDLPSDTVVNEKDWDKAMVYRLGTSYQLSDITVARFGFLIDQNPVPDTTFDGQLPDSDRYGISIGYGRKFGNFSIDASYMLLLFASRDKDNFVGYQDVGSVTLVDGVPTVAPGVKDGVVDAVDKGIMNQMVGGEYPVGTGTYKSHANLLSIAASYRF